MVSPLAAFSRSFVTLLMGQQATRLEPEFSLKSCISYEAILPAVRPGDGRREGEDKKNANEMIVFPGGLRMYQQRHPKNKMKPSSLQPIMDQKQTANQQSKGKKFAMRAIVARAA